MRLFGGENTMAWWQVILTFLLAGLIFSAVNSVIRPLIVILSLPFVLITMGLFMLLVNGFMVWLAILISPNIEMTFGYAIISSLVLSLVNYLVSGFSDFKKEEKIS